MDTLVKVFQVLFSGLGDTWIKVFQVLFSGLEKLQSFPLLDPQTEIQIQSDRETNTMNPRFYPAHITLFIKYISLCLPFSYPCVYHVYILCLPCTYSCVYPVHILCLPCTYPVFTLYISLCIPCTYPVFTLYISLCLPCTYPCVYPPVHIPV